MKPIRTIIVMLALTVSACATTSVSNEWKDPSWTGPPASMVVVVGIARSDTTRRIFEDTFANDLNAAGIHAIASYTQIQPGEANSTKLGDYVKSNNAEVVLVTRVQRVEQKVDVSPGYGPGGYGGVYGGYGRFYGWYGSAWASQPMVTSYDVVTLETTVWEPGSEKLIWAATTKRVASQDIPKVTSDLAHVLIPRLKSDHIIR